MKTNFKTHPYEFITESNFEIIKTCIEAGLRSNKKPVEIATNISKSTNIPQDVALALVNAEFIGVFEEMDKKNGKT